MPILTTLFFEDINQIAQKQPVLICFENFEATRQELQDWLLHLRAYKPSKHIRLAIAGREPLMAQWDPLRAVTKVIALDVFTMQEAEAFLDIYGITNKKRRSEIIEWSGRLPVLMSWLSTPQGSDSEPTLPTHDIVERFLRWVTNPTWRQVALLAAIPRTFNIDILQVLLREESRITFDEQEAFDWLRAMPFVQTRLQGWQYHPVVRRMMLRYQRQKSPQRYQQLHTALANFFNEKRTLHPSSSDEGWADEQWREHTLSYLYYFLLADPVQHWPAVISLLIVAIRKRRVFAREIVELLLEEDIYDQLRQEQNTLILLLRGQLQAIKDGNLSNGFEMFDQLCTLSSISTLAKCYIFAYRGESYRLKAQWDKALADFDHAISFDEKYTWALVCRGQTYRQMKRYEEALADFDRAISLDGEKDWILANRGETYRLMKRYEEALADFDRAISLNEKYTWALVSRGETYEAMKHYEEALADFDRAISLGATKFNARGLILSYLERYAEAIESYEQDLKNDSNNIYALYNIAVVQVRWKGPTQSQEFLDKAQKALTEALNTVLHSNALYGLGGIEALLGNIDQALEYLHQAILLNSSNVIGWARHDIAWNDLRMSANPRFEALLSESQESNDNAMN